MLTLHSIQNTIIQCILYVFCTHFFLLLGKLTAALVIVMTYIRDIGQTQIKEGKAMCGKSLTLCFGVAGVRTPCLL